MPALSFRWSPDRSTSPCTPFADTNPTSLPFGALHTPGDANARLTDGTLVGCAPPSLFFYQGQLRHQKDPGAAFAAAIEKHARQFDPPYFVHSWGGIEPGMLPIDPADPLEFWNVRPSTPRPTPPPTLSTSLGRGT